jgi:hypothetical protein
MSARNNLGKCTSHRHSVFLSTNILGQITRTAFLENEPSTHVRVVYHYKKIYPRDEEIRDCKRGDLLPQI